MLYVACRCTRASCYYWSSFLFLHEYLNACFAHLADDDVLGSGDANRAAISFLFTNQFAVDSIEFNLLAIAETADGDDTALGSNHHTAHLGSVDVVVVRLPSAFTQ